MALNGITIHALVYEMQSLLVGGRIQKIAQPEECSLLLTIHTESGQQRLYISANASLPLIYVTKNNRPSPMSAPSFCMVLRKYIANARILSIEQLGLERVIKITLEHLDELKDIAKKHLYIEIMGKHSNIIFTDDNDRIIDSIKHVGALLSSVREVLPGRDYFIPAQNSRMDALKTSREEFYNKVLSKKTTISKAIATSFTGFSTLTGNELAEKSGLDSALLLDTLHESELTALCNNFEKLKNDIEENNYSPEVILNEKRSSIEFSPFHLSLYPGNERIHTDSVSDAISLYYERRNTDNILKQRSADIKKILHNLIERANKKLALQEKQLSDTDQADKLRIFGELLQTYGHGAEKNAKSITVTNYYDNKEITIPLDPDLSGIENSKKYFEKYTKLKRTRDAIIPQLEHTREELMHLSSIATSLDMCESDDDIFSIKKELSDFGYIKKSSVKAKKKAGKNPPLHYVTKDGFDLYVGKNNYQNEEVTFKIGRGNDWWFHAKKMPGSHVILKNDGGEIPDHVFEQAANLAAYYSSGRDGSHVEVDYLKKKDVKRPNGAAPGFVIYYTNYSMMAEPDISSLCLVES